MLLLLPFAMKKLMYEEVKYISPNFTAIECQNQASNSCLNDFKTCVLITYIDYPLLLEHYFIL